MPRRDSSAVAGGGAADAEATLQARALAEPGDWLSLALEHHDQIRSAFTRAAQASPGGARIAALKGLAILLNGHSLAEEVVLYPALAMLQPKPAGQAYDEQAQAKIEMAKLERIDPASPDWAQQLETIRAAVLQHMLEEEGTWFLKLKQSSDAQPKLTARYKEEFERYTRTGIIATNGVWDGPPPRPVEA
jgi:hemerythrin superfamily protein